MTELTPNILDNIARDYHSQDPFGDKFIEDECQKYTYDWIFENIKNSKKVLELGFGEGNFTEQLVRRGYDVTLLEGSILLANQARSMYSNDITVIDGLFEEFKTTKSFDYILATHVLEHVDDPKRLLSNMKNWLKDDGRIIVVVPNKESLHRQIALNMGIINNLDDLSPRDILVGHQRVYSLKSLVSEVEGAGYSVVSTKGFFLKVIPNSLMINFPINLITALNSISPVIEDNLLANIGLVIQPQR